MQKLNHDLILKPSGLNNKFQGEKLCFDDYVKLMRDIIIQSRPDVSSPESAKIVTANSPFSWLPAIKNPKDGILFIHGLYDSPFYVRDLGEHFLKKGFLVRSILLPGHGTVPGDLLHIDYREWLKAVNYGIQSFTGVVENIYLAGYSIGGMLAIHQAITANHLNIKGLLLLAPAIKPRNTLRNLLARRYKLYSWVSANAKWYQIKYSKNFAKYSCYPLNAGSQACQLIRQVEILLKNKNINLPLFIVLSDDDETISENAILSFFKNQCHPKNRLLMYTNRNQNINDHKIIVRPSHFPDHRVINFSHICIPISPNNPLLGEKSTLIDLTHYTHPEEIPFNNLYRGSVNKNTLKEYKISRLSYNPDFCSMLGIIDDFIQSVE